jgi:hypothetical protein
MRIVVGGALLASATTLLFVGAGRVVEGRRTTAQVHRMREDLYRARSASDRCRSSLLSSESSLLVLTGTLDSMRSRVDSFEALGNGRVPADLYDEYLTLFEGYNDSVSAWETRSERLRTAEASCRVVIEGHNALSDSIQQVIRDAGVGGA